MQVGESRAHRFFSGKGFYVALAFSLLAVGSAAWLGVNSAINKLENKTPEYNNDTPLNEQQEWELPSNYEAAAPKNDVPATSKEETPSSKEEVKNSNTTVSQGYVAPLNGKVLNPFSGDKVVKSKTLDEWKMHTGIDLAAPISTPVKSISSGKVTEVKDDDMWGTTVTIEHANGIVSYYANLKPAVSVKEGQTVKMGEVIGLVGETAEIEQAEESHLHYEVMKNGNHIDPMTLIK